MGSVTGLLEACKLGRMNWKRGLAGKPTYLNPFDKGSEEHRAFQAGRANDLDAWMTIFLAASKKAQGPRRLKSMERIVFNAHTSRPDRGFFLGYDSRMRGYCRVYLERGGTKSVPRVSLTRAAEVAA